MNSISLKTQHKKHRFQLPTCNFRVTKHVAVETIMSGLLYVIKECIAIVNMIIEEGIPIICSK